MESLRADKLTMEFRPRISSSPVNEGLINYSSHVTHDSEILFPIGGQSPHQRHQAGLHVHNRIFDTHSRLNLELSPTEQDRSEDEDVVWNLKYIDDGLNGERLSNINAICHVTQRKEIRYVHAKKSERFLKLTMQNAKNIGMKINSGKTRMLCVNVARNSNMNSYIY